MIRTIGIPNALLSYRYRTFWKTFFEALGFTVVESGATTRTLLEDGEALSIDEACLASKVFMGHVNKLSEKVDAVFIPSFASVNVRLGFCTKFQSLPDLVRNTFRDKRLEVLSLDIQDVSDKRRTRQAYIDLVEHLGASPKEARDAYAAATAAQSAEESELAKASAETIRLMGILRKVAASDPSGRESAPPLILLIAHPYISHDRYICGDILDALDANDAVTIFADEFDHARALKRSFDFSETLPWMINRELAGAAMEVIDDVDGIVIVSSFPCGPDSMFIDAIQRRLPVKPMMHLVIDAQNGSAGVHTRIESFLDILRFKKQGGYLNV